MRFLSVLLASAAVVTAQSPLTTTFAGGNGQSGNMFELVAVAGGAGVTITGFEVNTNSTTPSDFEIYTLAGNYAGNENNAGAWTLVGSATGVPCNGFGTATPLPICVDSYIAPGATQSFYVTHSDTNILAYTNGTATGSLYASNADLEFYEGSGHAYPFNANFNPRVWNGNINYNLGNTSGNCPALVSYGVGCGGLGFASAYEQLTPTGMDLDGMIVSGLNTGAGYLIQVAPGAGNVAAGPSAAVLPLGDDDFQSAGGTLGIFVGSNGNIARGGANGNGFVPDVTTMLTNANEGLYAWTDLHSASGGGGGDILYEENGTEAIVTYLGVQGWNTGLPNTIQFKWDTATGNWSIEFDGLNTSNPEDWLVGYSPAGPNLDPGATDFSALNPGGVLLTAPFDSSDLALNGDFPRIGNTWNLQVDYVDPLSPVAITFLGQAAATPIPFSAIGLNAPGCEINLLTSDGSVTTPAAGGTSAVPLPIPNDPLLLSAQISAQSICLTPNNGAGFYASNGVTGTIGQ